MQFSMRFFLHSETFDGNELHDVVLRIPSGFFLSRRRLLFRASAIGCNNNTMSSVKSFQSIGRRLAHIHFFVFALVATILYYTHVIASNKSSIMRGNNNNNCSVCAALLSSSPFALPTAAAAALLFPRADDRYAAASRNHLHVAASVFFTVRTRRRLADNIMT